MRRNSPKIITPIVVDVTPTVFVPHNWSGWPGAWCLNCGAECAMEICLADNCPHFPFPEDEALGGIPAPCPIHFDSSCPAKVPK